MKSDIARILQLAAEQGYPGTEEVHLANGYAVHLASFRKPRLREPNWIERIFGWGNKVKGGWKIGQYTYSIGWDSTNTDPIYLLSDGRIGMRKYDKFIMLPLDTQTINYYGGGMLRAISEGLRELRNRLEQG